MDNKNNLTVVSEIYDLLNPSAFVNNEGADFVLSTPSTFSNLKEIRFRSFHPIVSRDIANSERLTSAVTIEPVVCAIDGDMNVSTAYMPDYLLHNEKGNLRLPIKGANYTVEFNGDLKDLIKDVNDALAGYCEDFDWDGWFTFSKADGSDPHYLQKKGVNMGQFVNYSAQWIGIARISCDKGDPSFNENNFLYSLGATTFLGPPDAPVQIQNLLIPTDERVIFCDKLTSDTESVKFNFTVDSGVYYYDPSHYTQLSDAEMRQYASKTNGQGIGLTSEYKLIKFYDANAEELTVEFSPASIAYVKNQYIATIQDNRGTFYISKDDGATWTPQEVQPGIVQITQGLTFGDYIILYSMTQGFYVYDSNFNIVHSGDIGIDDAVVVGDICVFVTGQDIYWMDQSFNYSQIGICEITPRLNSSAITTTLEYVTFSYNTGRCTIRDYYNQYMGTDNVLTPTATFSALNEDLTVKNLIFNLGDYVLLFVIDLFINPLDLINLSSFYQVFNATANLKNSWVITDNNCVTVSKNFDKNLMRASYLYGGKTLTLGCNLATNKSKKIYTDSENARIYFKYVKTAGSVPSVTVYLLNKNNEKIGLDYLNAIYDQIIVEIDYVYDTLRDA